MVKQNLWRIHFKKNTKLDSYILQNEDELYKWAHVKLYIVNNEVNTEIAKTKEKLRPNDILIRKKTYKIISREFISQK